MQVTALGPPALLERMSTLLVAGGAALDRGMASQGLHDALVTSLTNEETASLNNLMRRLDCICDAAVAKVPTGAQIGVVGCQGSAVPGVSVRSCTPGPP